MWKSLLRVIQEQASGSLLVRWQGKSHSIHGLPVCANADFSTCYSDEGGKLHRNPSMAQLPLDYERDTDQHFVTVHGSRGGGLRRMNSTPEIQFRSAPPNASGDGPMHMPSHPAPVSQPTSATVDPEVYGENEEFLNGM